MSYAGKRVWITGASSGIGAGLARAFGAQGATVILSGRNREALAEVAAAVPNHMVLPFEATDQEVLPRVVDHAGPVDFLINNAGISQRGLFEDTVMEVYRTIMEVDFFAPVHLTKLVLPQMLARGSGHIAVTASVAGKVGSPQRTGYCAAKHAVMGFFDALRTEVGGRGIRVTTIVPGFVKTEIGARALTSDGSRKGSAKGDDVDAGISPDEAAAQVLAGIAAGAREIRVGGGTPEMGLLDLKRNDPDALLDLMGQMGSAVVQKFKDQAAA
ncbi:SDR family NAD(P)-dependent oxidoreductase [Sandaracinobacteroides hominis]|uniref:SDR family NAD(P)-dependent oxidoreductase n=1 Tax=Sandaracinobacteroides hominis TaxID=2780086 RepID=UPI0018F7B691|nr:SDR family NAD(P)-dependent oxidoreductase [Sandaracinobacteroides hominis]